MADQEQEVQNFRSLDDNAEEIAAAPEAAPMPDPGASSGSMARRRKGRPTTCPETADPQELWDHFQKNPDFFAAIEIDKVSGRDEVKDLPHLGRYFSVVFSIAFAVLNFRNILQTNLVLLDDSRENKVGIFCISKTLMEQMFGIEVDIGVILATVELSYFALTILNMIYNLVMVILYWNQKVHKWIAFSRFMFSAWPQFANVTAIKLLYYVQITILIQALTKVIKQVFSGSWNGCGSLLWFLFNRSFILIMGMDTFLYKAQVLAIRFSDFENGNPSNEVAETMIQDAIVFILQVLGVVQLGRYARRRIFMFMFAGEDGQISEKELATKTIWEAQFSQWVWNQLSFLQAISCYLSFSDYDFQKLVLDNKAADTDPEKVSAAPACGWLTNICANLGIAL